MPTNQAKVLCLWDKIDLLHAERKQISGKIITILNFKVDANAMSAYLSVEKRECLVDSIHKFTQGILKTLQEWLRLEGQLNWALNIYLWLRLGLRRIYMEMVGKIQMWGRIKINKTIWHELAWFIKHVQQSSGLIFFKLMVWQGHNIGHSTLTIHINVSTQGLVIWFLSEKRGFQCPLLFQH